jgi:hypothetical protein
MPNFNPPAKVRLALYVLTAVGSVVVAYLKVKNVIGDPEIALWGGLVTVVNSMAALNTTVKEQ